MKLIVRIALVFAAAADLDATVARLKREHVKFLDEIHAWGNSRAAMIEGPDLVEVK